jgi:hypothetical protein
VGGSFANMGGGIGNVARSDIGRLSANGALDATFNPGANGAVLALLEETPGEILVGGSFTTLGGGGSGSATREFIGRLAPFVPPVITSPLDATSTVNEQFVYQFLASNASSLDVTNLPSGLNFDSNLGVISGMPADVGTFSVGLSASNEDGDANATLTLTVQPFPTSGPGIMSSTSATGRTGQPFFFQVVTQGASPAARVSATGLPAGLSIDHVTGEITGSATNDGSSAVTLKVTDGSLTTIGTLELTFSSDPDLPVITSSTQAFLEAGQPLNYQIVTSAQDPFDDIDYQNVFALPAGLGLDQATGLISGVFPGTLGPLPGPQLSGGVVTNVQLFATNSSGTATSPLTFFVRPAGTRNISTRLAVGTGDNVLIGGFIITGNAPKKVLIRAIGPSLKSNGIALPGRLLDPTLELHDKDGLLDSNDNWRSSQEQEIINTTIPPPNDNESAIVAILSPLDPAIPNSGAYTVIVKGKNNSTGIALVEIYDLGTASFDVSSESHLANISTRGKVQTGDNVMIGGFILGGSDPSKVLLRAIGPELTAKGVAGALQDTVVELRNANGALVSSNDDWQSTQKQAIIDTGVPPTDPRESAIVATLNPGNYTGIVRGKNDTTGVALVEVYVLP